MSWLLASNHCALAAFTQRVEQHDCCKSGAGEKAAVAVVEAMELWLESAVLYGDPVPEPDLAAAEDSRGATLSVAAE